MARPFFTTERFINNAEKIHKGYYNYSKVNYINNKTHVEIICLTHGSFIQTPTDHISGRGCQKCGWDRGGKINRLTTKEFIETAKKIHGNLFDYSKVQYVNYNTKVELVCKIHGSFWQKPKKHINDKQGCKKCAGKISGPKSSARYKTKENKEQRKIQFIKDAIMIHGNKYDYSLVEYENARKKVKLICPNHGIFELVPDKHVHDRGCPKCSGKISKPETIWLDFLNIKSRQKYIKSPERQYSVDGFDIKTNTCYEFLGDLFHGNPERFDPNKICFLVKKPFKFLYDRTIDRFNFILNKGYNIFYIWESDFNKGLTGKLIPANSNIQTL